MPAKRPFGRRCEALCVDGRGHQLSTRILILLFGLIGGQSIADEAREADVLLDFATRGLDVEFPLMLESIDNLTNVVGLPSRIEIDREGSWWDIDIRETDALWVYDGYSVLTRFYQQGEPSNGKLIAGTPKLDYVVYGLSVTDASVKTALGVGVGLSAEQVYETLGKSRAQTANPTRINYYVETGKPRDINVLFVLDSPGGTVTEIHWTTTSWH